MWLIYLVTLGAYYKTKLGKYLKVMLRYIDLRKRVSIL